MILREVEYFLRQKSKDGHVIFTDGETGVTRCNDLVDEGRPVARPLLFQNGNKNEIEFVQERAFGSETFFRLRAFDNEVDNEVSNA